MHKHFRMINLQRHFNKISPRQCSITELWEKLGTMYNLQALDERVNVLVRSYVLGGLSILVFSDNYFTNMLACSLVPIS